MQKGENAILSHATMVEYVRIQMIHLIAIAQGDGQEELAKVIWFFRDFVDVWNSLAVVKNDQYV